MKNSQIYFKYVFMLLSTGVLIQCSDDESEMENAAPGISNQTFTVP
ncbi:MAG: hypothetical protein GDA51_06535 [Ekhidna sp.]|nr:hypothetical protein [Ekhidna sp.]